MKSGMRKSVCQKSSDNDGRRKAEQKFAAGTGKKFRVGAMSLGGGGRRGNGDRDERFDQPNRQPSLRRQLARRDVGRDQSRNAHGHAAPAGNGGELRRTFHGFANVAKMVGSARVDGDWHAGRRTKWAGQRHRGIIARQAIFVKYFILQSKRLDKDLFAVAIASQDGVKADCEYVNEHPDAVAHHVDFGGGRMRPTNGNFDGAQSIAAGEK
jgi:hypothetical protein